MYLTAGVFGGLFVFAIANLFSLRQNENDVRAILRSSQLGGLVVCVAMGWMGWDALLIPQDQYQYAEVAPSLILVAILIFAVSWVIYVRRSGERFRVACAAISDLQHSAADRAQALLKLLAGDQQGVIESRVAKWGPVAAVAGMAASSLGGHRVVSAFFFVLLSLIMCPAFLGALAGFKSLESKFLPKHAEG
ncbi:hypothetical protein ACFPOE_21960 [Caenimonas terrae]|uniref:MotA/TolQ/ExbB proton channel domain-containing protein n=1 Tax=Caenimonas terrae TaxID=696074 RepID=A0ABW0NKF0_9BURK